MVGGFEVRCREVVCGGKGKAESGRGEERRRRGVGATRLAVLGELSDLLRHLLPPVLRRSKGRHSTSCESDFTGPGGRVDASRPSAAVQETVPFPSPHRPIPRLRELRDVEADEVAVVGRVDAQVTHLDGALDVLHSRLVERLDDKLRTGLPSVSAIMTEQPPLDRLW